MATTVIVHAVLTVEFRRDVRGLQDNVREDVRWDGKGQPVIQVSLEINLRFNIVNMSR